MRRVISLGRQALLGALVAVCGLASMDVQAQEVVADFKAGPPTGVYAFASSTPKALPDLVKPGASGGAVNIVGHLFLPQGSGKVPVVLLMHGSGGIYNAMLGYWPKLLNAQGIAVFSLDRFGPRGVKSTAEDQSQVPFAADVADAFAALRLLASHPRIDAKRIAIMGFSRGGVASWRTAVERIIAAQQLPDGSALCGAYPGVFGRLLRHFPADRQTGCFLQGARAVDSWRCGRLHTHRRLSRLFTSASVRRARRSSS